MSGKWWFDSSSSQGYRPKPAGFRPRPAQPLASPLWPPQPPVSCLGEQSSWESRGAFSTGLCSRPAPCSGSTSSVALAFVGAGLATPRDPPEPPRPKLRPECPSRWSQFSDEEMLICHVRLHVSFPVTEPFSLSTGPSAHSPLQQLFLHSFLSKG